MEPYYSDASVTLHLGDCRDVLPQLDLQADAIVTDPPYGETTLKWDQWPEGWPTFVAGHANSMWSFGSLRMFGEHWSDFAADWTYGHDVVWNKRRASSFTKDRFRRSHEYGAHWYQGRWSAVYKEPQRVRYVGPDSRHGYRGSRLQHAGEIASQSWVDSGTRLMLSVLDAPTMWRRGQIHPTEKSAQVLTPLLKYAVPPGGLVLDPFAGSASTLLTARMLGRRAVGIEANEAYCEAAAQRLAVLDLFGGAA